MISFPLNHISKKKHETNNQITSFPSQENVFFTLKVFIPFIITGNPLLPVISNRPLHTTNGIINNWSAPLTFYVFSNNDATSPILTNWILWPEALYITVSPYTVFKILFNYLNVLYVGWICQVKFCTTTN